MRFKTRNIIPLLLILLFCSPIWSQYEDKEWFYFRALDENFEPEFIKEGDRLVYNGNDKKLKEVLSKHKIYIFKKTYRNASRKNLKRTFFVVAENENLLPDLLRDAPHLFGFGELIAPEDKRIFEPNDYGLTSTIGTNEGEPVVLDYLDFLEAPKAWYYTTGSKDVVIGISDGRLDTIHPDFKGKTKIIKAPSIANGHGYSTAANAAAQGDNKTGIVGVCYNCSLYGTNYGEFKDLRSLVELSEMGVRIINCSWIGQQYYETAQEIINEMYDKGTILVASGGNKDWNITQKKNLIYYPASYDKVISVSSVMYKQDGIRGNIEQDKDGNYFVINARHYVGRSLGFKDNDTLNEPHIWKVSTATLNPFVDILAPTAGLFRFSKYILEDGKLSYSEFETTSAAAPMVSGTIGLMLSLNPCLPVQEIEGILKLAATNIDDIKANQFFYGNYGAGALNTGRTIELLYNLYTEDEIAYLKDQDFPKWEFNIRSFAKKTILENEIFRDAAKLNLESKQQIILSENTILKPNQDGSIRISIDPDMEKDCELRLRDPNIAIKD